MRKGILLAGLVLVLLMGMNMVSADDDPTPKPGTAADNECYPGGVLYREENQDGCPTLWYWKAGWFLARYNQGLISREAFPKEFESVLPSEFVAQCWQSKFQSVLYIGPANQKGNIKAYLGNSHCTGPEFPIPGGKSFVVFANNLTDATAICTTQGTVLFVQKLYDIGYSNAPSNAYGCAVA